jgi:hypothetical protein
MTKYVKAKGSDTWHWCRNCSNYPTNIGDTKSIKPTSGELCNQCKTKDRAGTCKK